MTIFPRCNHRRASLPTEEQKKEWLKNTFVKVLRNNSEDKKGKKDKSWTEEGLAEATGKEKTKLETVQEKVEVSEKKESNIAETSDFDKDEKKENKRFKMVRKRAGSWDVEALKKDSEKDSEVLDKKEDKDKNKDKEAPPKLRKRKKKIEKRTESRKSWSPNPVISDEALSIYANEQDSWERDFRSRFERTPDSFQIAISSSDRNICLSSSLPNPSTSSPPTSHLSSLPSPPLSPSASWLRFRAYSETNPVDIEGGGDKRILYLLQELKLTKYWPRFLQEEILLEDLHDMTEDDLMNDFGMTKWHGKRLLKTVQNLQSQGANFINSIKGVQNSQQVQTFERVKDRLHEKNAKIGNNMSGSYELIGPDNLNPSREKNYDDLSDISLSMKSSPNTVDKKDVFDADRDIIVRPRMEEELADKDKSKGKTIKKKKTKKKRSKKDKGKAYKEDEKYTDISKEELKIDGERSKQGPKECRDKEKGKRSPKELREEKDKGRRNSKELREERDKGRRTSVELRDKDKEKARRIARGTRERSSKEKGRGHPQDTSEKERLTANEMIERERDRNRSRQASVEAQIADLEYRELSLDMLEWDEVRTLFLLLNVLQHKWTNQISKHVITGACFARKIRRSLQRKVERCRLCGQAA